MADARTRPRTERAPGAFKDTNDREATMPDERELPEGVPPATEDIGLPTPPSPGQIPPIDLPPPAPEAEPALDKPDEAGRG